MPKSIWSRCQLFSAAAAAAVSLVAGSARAADFTWDGAVGDYNEPTNWNPDQVPSGGAGNFAHMNNGGTANTAVGYPAIQDILFDGAGGGTVNHSGGLGDLSTGWLRIGVNAGNTGNYNLTGSATLNTGRIRVGEAGGGTYTQSDTAVATLTNRFEIADGGAGSTGTATINGGTLNIGNQDNNSLNVARGNGSVGTLNINGGTVNAPNGDVFIGTDAGSNGTVNQTGGTANLTTGGNWTFIGRDGTGTYNLSGGTLQSNNELRIGQNEGSTGLLNVDGGAVQGPAVLIAGAGGTGTLDISNGTVTANEVRIGEGGTGNLIISGGTLTANAQLIMKTANEATEAATATQTGGTVQGNTYVSIGQNGPATYTISGGVLTATTDFNVGDVGTSAGTLNLMDGIVNAGAAAFVGKNAGTSGVVTQTGGRFEVGANDLTIASGAGSVGTYNLGGTGVLDGNGNDVRFGAGTAAFNFTGGRMENVASTNFSVNQTGGSMAPGAAGAVGLTTITGDYTLGAAGDYRPTLEAGGMSDRLDVSGTATLAGLLNVEATPGLTTGQTFLILTPGTLVGQFSNAPTGVPFSSGGYTFNISYTAGDGNDVALIVVPEPASAGLVGLAAAGLLLRRRRQRA